jgi:photosystem II stability/assembly factor-like uncharacterized protein
MKTLVLLFTTITFFNAQSQNAWQIISPHPTGINLRGVSMISESEYWIAGMQGRVFHTDDAGVTWDVYNAASEARYYQGIKMFDANNGWINAYGDTLFKTNDGGQTWIPVLLPSHTYQWYWKNMNEGWVSGNADTLFHTVNAGVTWTVDTFPGAAIRYIGFSDTTHGWVIADNGAIWKTIDGGFSWSKISNANTTFTGIRAISFPDSMTGYFSTFNWDNSSSSLFKSIDGGMSWSQITTYPNMIYGGGVIAFFDTSRGIMLDALANEYRLTFDGGNTWSPYSVGVDGPLVQIDYFNSTFVAIGSPGNIIQSNDLGLTYTNVVDRINCGEIRSNICFVDSLTGFMLSSGLHKTIDGGFTWTQLDSFYVYNNDKVYFINNLTGWRTGGVNCTVKRSGDGGITWTNSAAPQYSLNDFCFATTNLGWGVDGLGKIVSTTDGGIHWQIDTSVNYPSQFYKIAFTDSLHGWAAGGSTAGYLTIWNTVDGGSTWSRNFDDTTSTIHGPSITLAAVGQSHVWVAGNNNRLRITIDGGISWTLTSFFTTTYSFVLPHLLFIDTLNGLCGGQFLGSDLLLKTSDGGFTWVAVLQNNAESISSISYVDSSHIWVAGTPSYLAVYRPINSTNIPSAVNTSHLEIFPNPASGKVVLHSKLTSGIYSIILTDITGRTVSEHLWKVLTGEEFYSLDISVLARGVYFVHVSGKQMDAVSRFVKQ